MTPAEREQTAGDLAGILARGYDLHVAAHGPDGSFAVRTPDGSRYQVAEDGAHGAISFIERGGERFAVNVIPLDRQNESGAPFAYVPAATGDTPEANGR
jgi:hypothetical protein